MSLRLQIFNLHHLSNLKLKVCYHPDVGKIHAQQGSVFSIGFASDAGIHIPVFGLYDPDLTGISQPVEVGLRLPAFKT